MENFREIICGGASNKELAIASGCVVAFMSVVWIAGALIESLCSRL